MKRIGVVMAFLFLSLDSFADGCSGDATFTATYDSLQCCWSFFNTTTNDCMQWNCTWDFGDGSPLVTTPQGVGTACHPYMYSGTYTVTLTFDSSPCHGGSGNICVGTQEVTIPPLSVGSIVSDYNGSNVSCEGGDDGWITLNAAVGYSYEWQTNPVLYTNSISNLSAGTYTCEVGYNGCVSILTFVITEPNIQMNEVITPTCYGLTDGDIINNTSGGLAPYTYLWSTGDTTANLTNIDDGIYSVQVIDSYGCIDSATYIVSEAAQLFSQYSTSDYNGYNISCYGYNDGYIDLAISGSVPPYYVSWSSGQGTLNISSLYSGIYNVNIIDANDCEDSLEIIISEPPPIVTNIESLTNFNGYDISCHGFSDGSIDLSASGAYPPFSYNWNTGETSEDLDSLIAGTYTVTITDTNGCPHITDIELIEPSLLVDSIESVYNYNNYQISCYNYNDGAINLSVFGAVSPYYYEWSNLSNFQDISNLSEGWYFVDITDANGCDISDSIFLAQPTPLEIDIQSNTNYNGYDIRCHGNSDGSINLTVTGSVPGYIYLWNNNDAIEDPINLPAGTYDVFVTDQNFCTIDTAIILYQPEKLFWDAEVYPDTCEQQVGKIENVQISGGVPGYILSWLNVNPPPITVQLLGGEYHIEIKDSNSCLLNDTIVILNLGHPDEMVFSIISSPKHLYDQLFDPIVFIDMTNTFPFWNKVTNWHWDFGDQTYSADSVAFHSYQAIGEYDVVLQLTTDHKCIDTLVRKVVIKEYDLFIPDAFTPNSDDNINKGFRPYGIGIDEFLMNIYTRWGGLVYSTTNINEEWNGRLNNSEQECQVGVYTYYIEVKDTFGATHKYIGKVHLIR